MPTSTDLRYLLMRGSLGSRPLWFFAIAMIGLCTLSSFAKEKPTHTGQATVFGLTVQASKEQVRRRLGPPEQDSGMVWTYRVRGLVIYYGAYGRGKTGVERFFTPQLEVDDLSTVKLGMSPGEVSTALGKPVFVNSQMLRYRIGLDVIEARLDQKPRVESLVLKRHTTPPPQP